MRMLKLFILAVLAVLLIAVGAANMAPVDLYIFPQSAGISAMSFPGVPLAVVIMGAVAVGIVIGLVLEWLRERRHRAELQLKRREVGRLRREVDELRSKVAKDEIDLPTLRAS